LFKKEQQSIYFQTFAPWPSVAASWSMSFPC
jgi:hypothetical protein